MLSHWYSGILNWCIFNVVLRMDRRKTSNHFVEANGDTNKEHQLKILFKVIEALALLHWNEHRRAAELKFQLKEVNKRMLFHLVTLTEQLQPSSTKYSKSSIHYNSTWSKTMSEHYGMCIKSDHYKQHMKRWNRDLPHWEGMTTRSPVEFSSRVCSLPSKAIFPHWQGHAT